VVDAQMALALEEDWVTRVGGRNQS
jgi:hypothetical protein